MGFLIATLLLYASLGGAGGMFLGVVVSMFFGTRGHQAQERVHLLMATGAAVAVAASSLLVVAHGRLTLRRHRLQIEGGPGPTAPAGSNGLVAAGSLFAVLGAQFGMGWGQSFGAGWMPKSVGGIIGGLCGVAAVAFVRFVDDEVNSRAFAVRLLCAAGLGLGGGLILARTLHWQSHYALLFASAIGTVVLVTVTGLLSVWRTDP
jgi:hypothetical protein